MLWEAGGWHSRGGGLGLLLDFVELPSGLKHGICSEPGTKGATQAGGTKASCRSCKETAGQLPKGCSAQATQPDHGPAHSYFI